MTDNKLLRPAIFADRDGTLVEEVNYLSRIEDLRLLPNTYKALHDLKAAGYAIIVITNQSGIGKGYYTTDDMNAIHRQMQFELDGVIDGFYHCPHRPDAGCECRKPKVKLLLDAQRELELDLPQSWMIGDKDIDIQTGANLNLKTILVSTGYGSEHKDSLKVQPTFFASEIGDAADIILGRSQS